MTALQVKELARSCGFDLVGIAPAIASADFERFEQWRQAGMAGEMTYLTDRRGDLRSDPRQLLPDAQSIICVGKLYNTAQPHTADIRNPALGWVSRYAWGDDYHNVLRAGLEKLAGKIAELYLRPFSWRACVDTAPLLERSYARAAGLGWIGKNTCLINQERGSWFFLGELLLSIPLAPDYPPPDRCGTCRRCIDACPTDAIVWKEGQGWVLDARDCISYLTIEKRGAVPDGIKSRIANHVFGCDICQDVCPWNDRAPDGAEAAFAPRQVAPPLAQLAALTKEEFGARYRNSPVKRTKYSGFLRNVAIALSNAGNEAARNALQKLSWNNDPHVSETARDGLRLMDEAAAR